MGKRIGSASLAAITMAGLAACSGQDPQTAGSSALVSTAAPGTFVAPTETKTYKGIGAVQSYAYTYTERASYPKDVVLDAAGKPVLDEAGFPTRAVNPNNPTLVGRGQDLQLYAADAATVRDPGITVTYDPRAAQFTLAIAQGSVAQSITFQDPAHRTDFGGAIEPQAGVPDIQGQGIRYLQVNLSTDPNTYDAATFFYQQPGTSTKYVTYAGYVRNRYDQSGSTLVSDDTLTQTADLTRKTLRERGAFVFGEQTALGSVPTTGTATFAGNMLASMANNPDFENSQQTYYQWINGTQTTTVDFASHAVSTTMTGIVGAPLLDSPIANVTVPAASVPIGAGSTFTASATAQIDLVGKGGFTGTFGTAQFTTPTGTVQNVAIAGSSLDGAFYGPKAEEVGASFRVVGGVPDQRVDVIGSFTGARR